MNASTGTAKLGTFERVFCGIVAVMCLGVLVWLGVLLTSMPGAPADTSGRSAGTQDRDLMIKGAYLAWQAVDACAQGPQECERMLTALNAEAASYGLVVFEDGSVSPVEDTV